jgi:hypothetical protein
MRSLCAGAKSISRFYAAQPMVMLCSSQTHAHLEPPEPTMPDIVPLLIAAAVFALFFAYVPLCAKI